MAAFGQATWELTFREPVNNFSFNFLSNSTYLEEKTKAYVEIITQTVFLNLC